MTTTSDPHPGDQLATAVGAAAVVPHSSRGHSVTRGRRTRLTITRVDPWSVLRLAFLMSLAVAIVTVIAIMLLWGLLAAGGVFDSVDNVLQDILGTGSDTITNNFGFGRVLSLSLLLSAVDVVLITAIATIGAFLFNLVTALSGGLEVTANEDL